MMGTLLGLTGSVDDECMITGVAICSQFYPSCHDGIMLNGQVMPVTTPVPAVNCLQQSFDLLAIVADVPLCLHVSADDRVVLQAEHPGDIEASEELLHGRNRGHRVGLVVPLLRQSQGLVTSSCLASTGDGNLSSDLNRRRSTARRDHSLSSGDLGSEFHRMNSGLSVMNTRHHHHSLASAALGDMSDLGLT